MRAKLWCPSAWTGYQFQIIRLLEPSPEASCAEATSGSDCVMHQYHTGRHLVRQFGQIGHGGVVSSSDSDALISHGLSCSLVSYVTGVHGGGSFATRVD
jgi:hypothetical protein